MVTWRTWVAGALGGLLGALLKEAWWAWRRYRAWEHAYYRGPAGELSCFDHPRGDLRAASEAEQFGAYMEARGLRRCSAPVFWLLLALTHWRWRGRQDRRELEVGPDRPPPWRPGGAELPGFGAAPGAGPDGDDREEG